MDSIRTRQILDYVKTRKPGTLKELMQKFRISSATVHRDVVALAARDAVGLMRVGLLACFAFAPAAVRAERIALANGTASCLVDTWGGRVLSCRMNGEEILWQEGPSARENGPWVHGGIPVAWPWFGRLGGGDGDIHGYAWKSEFRVRERTADRVVLSLETESATLRYEIELSDGLSLCAETTNRSGFPYPLSVAFHPYFRVGERDSVSVEGIDEAPVPVTNAVDRGVGFDAAAPRKTYCLHDAALGRTLRIEAENSTGVNLWNPGAEKKCPGFIPGDGWRRFVAVEPYARGVNRFLVLKPHEKHVLRMKVTCAGFGGMAVK